MSTIIHECYFSEFSKAISSVNLENVVRACEILHNVRALEKTVYLVGNGGSAATSMHFAQDLQKACGMNAISVPAMIVNILAYGNDTRWEYMFREYLKATMRSSDVLVAISCSGRSENVLQAVRFARVDLNAKVIALTGRMLKDNSLASESPGIITIGVDHPDIKIQEDIHLAICHSIVGALSA